MLGKTLVATAGFFVAVVLSGCATTTKEGLNGPSINMDEPEYNSSIERSKDRPQVEREARVDFFKYKQGF